MKKLKIIEGGLKMLKTKQRCLKTIVLSLLVACMVMVCFMQQGKLFPRAYASEDNNSEAGEPAIELQINNPTMKVNGIEKEINPGKGTAPILVNGQILLPIGALIEELGGSFGWDGDEQKVTLKLMEKEIQLWVNTNKAVVNGNEKKLDVPPQIINGSIMIPLRFVLENFGFCVNWNGTDRKIIISNQPPSAVTSASTVTPEPVPKGAVVLTGNIGDYKIDKTGTYVISGTVTGNITADLQEPGEIVIMGQRGTDPVVFGIPRPGEKRHVSHIIVRTNADHKVTIKNFRIEGNGHNALECNGDGTKLIKNIHIINYTRVIDGEEVFGAGSINAEENSKIVNCYMETGDDAIKITEPNSRAYNNTVVLKNNGSAIQLGWGKRGNGPNHIAENTTVKGSSRPNPNHPNDSRNPGRSIIGGVFENNISNIRITGLKVHGTYYGHVIKLVAYNGAVVDNVYIEGTLLDGIENVDSEHTAIVLIAEENSQIKNVTIDLGEEAADPQYHYIKGDVDVTFVTNKK